MTLHPLQHAYIKAVKKLCCKNAGVTNSKVAHAKVEQLGDEVCKLGLDADTYMYLAVSLCTNISKVKGWPYPYWSMVSGEWVYAKISKLVKDLDWNIVESTEHLSNATYELELVYAVDYIAWKDGKLSAKPERLQNAYPSTVARVIKYLKVVYGLSGQAFTYEQLWSLVQDAGQQSNLG